MPPKRKTKKRNFTTTAPKPPVVFSPQYYLESIQLPQKKDIREQLYSFCQRQNIVLYINWNRTQSISIVCPCARTGKHVSYEIKQEIQRLMTVRNRPPISILISSPKLQSKRQRPKPLRFSKNVNTTRQNKRKYWNQVIRSWENWFKYRSRFKENFKRIRQYFRQMIRYRHRSSGSWFRMKRTALEYRKKEILGRQRDQLKQRRAEARQLSNMMKRKKEKKNKQFSTRNNIFFRKCAHLLLPGMDRYQVTKPKRPRAIHPPTLDNTTDIDLHRPMKKIKMQPKNHQERPIPRFQFSFLSNRRINRHIPKRNIILHYSNQCVFVYQRSSSCFRHSKKNLIQVFSTLTTDETFAQNIF